MTRDLAGLSVLVTGAAQGIGRAVALAAADAGARVIILDRNGAGAAETAETLQGRGTIALAVEADLASASDLASACATIAGSAAGWPDVVVNNAGIQEVAPVLGLTEAAWSRTLAVNLVAPFMLAQRIARQWVERRTAGVVVNVASIAGRVHFDGHAAYSASKAGLAAVTGAMALELAPHGIRVNAVAPGHIDTALSLARTPDQIAARLRDIPLGRLGRPADVASVVVFLASSRASYITGQTLTVDGGVVLT
jgi:NAD(P)-dependent dehydrogenase (short-subunit alcohol dehydrogenase family)